MSNSLQPHGLKHARFPCPSLSPGVCSNSCHLSRWCHHPAISSCHPLLLLPSILPSIRVFSSESALHIRWPNIRVSASVLPENIQGEKGHLSCFFCIIPNLLHSTLNWKHFIMTQPTPMFLPGESQGWGSLVGCRLWGHIESDMTDAI